MNDKDKTVHISRVACCNCGTEQTYWHTTTSKLFYCIKCGGNYSNRVREVYKHITILRIIPNGETK